MNFVKLVVCLFLTANLAHAQIRVGFVVPLTGSAAHIGEEVRRVAELLESKRCPEKCEFLMEDGKAGTDSAPVSAMNKLLRRDSVRLLLAASSGEVLQMAPIVEREDVVLMGVYSGHPDIKKFGDTVYRTFPDFEGGAQFLARFMKSVHSDPLALLTEEHAFTRGMSDLIISSKEVSICADESVPFDEMDYRSVLSRMRQRKPKAYYLSCVSPRSCASMVQQARQLGIQEPLYSFLHLDNPEFLSAAGSFAEGVRFLGTPPAKEMTDEFRGFLAEYQSHYPEGPRNEFVLRTTYDGLNALLDCAEVDRSPSAVRACLSRYRKHGALGAISFDRNGDIEGVDYVMKEISAGKPVVFSVK